MDRLVLVRHGESEWNLKNLFTGWKDPDLTAQGVEEARTAGRASRRAGLPSTSPSPRPWRAQETLRLCSRRSGGRPADVRDQALNERDYGDLAGLNKDDARKRWGDEQVHLWRRSYDVSPPGGESLKDTAARVLPYYDAGILPRVIGASACSSRRTATRCGRSSWCSTSFRKSRSLRLNLATGLAAPLPPRQRRRGRGEARAHGLDRDAFWLN